MEDFFSQLPMSQRYFNFALFLNVHEDREAGFGYTRAEERRDERCSDLLSFSVVQVTNNAVGFPYVLSDCKVTLMEISEQKDAIFFAVSTLRFITQF